jgi:hypothetical protein
LHHLVHRGSGNEEVPLDIRFGGRSAELADVLADESKVLALALGGPMGARPADLRAEASLTGFDEKDGAVGEVNAEMPPVCGGEMGYFVPRELPGEGLILSLMRHGDALILQEVIATDDRLSEERQRSGCSTRTETSAGSRRAEILRVAVTPAV